MDYQAAFNVCFLVAAALGGFILRAVWAALTKLTDELTAIQKALPETYVRRDDFMDRMDRVERILERIEIKLDSKVDR